MDPYLVINIGLIVVVLVVLALVTWRLRRWRWQQYQRWGDGVWSASTPANASDLGAVLTRQTGPRAVEARWVSAVAIDRFAERWGAARRLVLVLNIATTLIALIPLALAVYNVATNHQTQALTFNLAALATLIVTKSGLLVAVSLFVKGAITGAGGYVGQQAMKKVWGRRKAQKEQPPTT